jgi:two-component system NtrC family sensor kinase
MLENATRLCEANFGTLYFHEAEGFRAVSVHGAPPSYLKTRLGSLFQPTPSTALGRVVRTEQVVHIEDVTADRAYFERDPMRVSAVEEGGVRTPLGVPMLKDNEVIGAIGVYRETVRPFTDRHVELVTNFAAQAASDGATLARLLSCALRALGDANRVVSALMFYFAADNARSGTRKFEQAVRR